MTAVAAASSHNASSVRNDSPDVYRVRSGDTLSEIAAAHGVSLPSLLRANPQILHPDMIHPGQAVNIPSGRSGGAEAAPATYTVQRGDTLSRIGERFGVDWRILAQVNGLSDPDLIRPGQRLQLGAADSGGSAGGAGTREPAGSGGAGGASAGTPTAATGALPDTAGMGPREKYDLYASYVNTYGSDAAKADLAAGRQVILGLRDPSSLSASGGGGAYNDRVVVLSPGGKTAREFSANTEPSSQYEGRYGADANGDGRKDLGQIDEGTIQFRRDRSANLGDVLRPTGSHGIERDVNHDGRIADGEGRGGSTDRSFLFHSGGNTNTGSAGCQTMRPGD